MSAMGMQMSAMPKTLQTLTGYSATVSTTPVEGRAITAVQGSISSRGNQPLLPVPMNVNPAVAMATHMIVTTTQRLTVTKPAKPAMASLKEEGFALTVSITQQASTVRDASQGTTDPQTIQ